MFRLKNPPSENSERGSVKNFLRLFRTGSPRYFHRPGRSLALPALSASQGGYSTAQFAYDLR